MELKIKNGVFWCKASYEERLAPKAAGFTFHGNFCTKNCKACKAGIEFKVWFSPVRECAVSLIDHADSEAKAALQEVVNNITESRAAEAPEDLNIPAPAGLDYLPYQKAGIAYAMKRKNVLILDDMGLGKTIQGIGVVNADTTAKKVLVVCPASLRLNWKRELTKWLVRSFSVSIVEDKKDFIDVEMIYHFTENVAVIINYDKLISPEGAKFVQSFSWDVLIVDEAHYVKNTKSKRAKAVLGFRKGKEVVEGLMDRTRRTVILTGTPILNKPIEMWALIEKTDPDDLGKSMMAFAKRYCNAYQGRWGWDMSGASNLEELQTRLRSKVMVRRLKKDVLKELPPKRRQVIAIPEDGTVKKFIAKENEMFEKRQETIANLQTQMTLAHIAGDKEEYEKAVQQLKYEGGIAFTEMAAVRHSIALAKVPYVIEHVDNALESIDKIILFAHHRDVIEQLQEHFGNRAVSLTGETKMEDRQAAVDRFQNDPTCNLFIGSIKAAGVGLTLTAASTVIFAELDWVPANISQAEDRAHRIGQTESVLIQHLVFDNTIDARMAEMIVEKQNIADRALDIEPQAIEVPSVQSKEKSVAGEISLKKKYPEATHEERNAAAAGIQRVAMLCDGASREDGTGFNKMDTSFGKALAERSSMRDLTDGEVFAVKKLLKKYWRQVSGDVLVVLGIERSK